MAGISGRFPRTEFWAARCRSGSETLPLHPNQHPQTHVKTEIHHDPDWHIQTNRRRLYRPHSHPHGTFKQTGERYSGRIHTLTFDAELWLIPVQNDTENAPDFRIYLRKTLGPEVGAAWWRRSDKAGDYLSCEFDDPLFGQPIRASLLQLREQPDLWVLHWTRPTRRHSGDREGERGDA